MRPLSARSTIPAPPADCGGENKKKVGGEREKGGLTPRTKEGWGGGGREGTQERERERRKESKDGTTL